MWAFCMLLPVTLGMKVPFPPVRVEPPFILLMSDVGLAPGAVVSANITVSEGGAVLMLLTKAELSAWVTWMLKLPPRDLENVTSYFTSQWRQPFRRSISARLEVPGVTPDIYVVGIFHRGGARQVFQGQLDFVNPHNQHLPLQLVHVPFILEMASVAFLLPVQAAAAIMLSASSSERHKLLGLLMAAAGLKAFELAAKANLYRDLELAGEVAEWKLQACLILKDLHGLFELLLMGLISLGWKISRLRLSRPEQQGVRFCFLFYLSLVLLQAVAAAPLQPVFRLMFFSLRVTIYLCIIFALSYSLQSLAWGMEGLQFCAMAVMCYRKREALFRFRAVYYMMLFRPLVLITIQLNLLTDINTKWAVYGLKEASMWCIYWGLLFAVKPPGRDDLLLQFASGSLHEYFGLPLAGAEEGSLSGAALVNAEDWPFALATEGEGGPNNLDRFLLLQATLQQADLQVGPQGEPPPIPPANLNNEAQLLRELPPELPEITEPTTPYFQLAD